MADRRSHALDASVEVRAVFSDRSDGDLATPPVPRGGPGDPTDPLLHARRARLAPGPWTWLRQVHGARVVTVHSPGDRAGAEADACVTACRGATLSVQVADCAPVLMFSPGPGGAVVAAAHAGWRGIEAGVLAATVGAMEDLGATDIHWWVGPCISAAAYEFSEADLDRLAGRLGPGVRSVTAEGQPALDMSAAVASAMRRAGVRREALAGPSTCTATSAEHWSHRGSADRQRQVGAIWWEVP